MKRLVLTILLVAGFSGSVGAEVYSFIRINNWDVVFVGSEKGKVVGGWCLLSQDNFHASGQERMTIIGPRTFSQNLVGVPLVQVGNRKPIDYQIDDGPIVPIKPEWQDGEFLELREIGLLQKMMSGIGIVIHLEPQTGDGEAVPNIEYGLVGLEVALGKFAGPVCRENIKSSE